MGFLSRMANLWGGFLSLFVEGIEAQHPEIVYESAIEDKKRQFHKLRDAVAGIVRLRNKQRKTLQQKMAELQDIQGQIPIAVESGEDDVALVLIERKNSLTAEVEHLQAELQQTETESEEAKSSLLAFQSEIDALKKEKDMMIAHKQDAESRLQIQDALDGLSTTSSMKALDNVRDSIGKLRAEADVAREMKDSGLSTKLDKIRRQTRVAGARSELDEMKKQLQASQATQQKTMG